MNLKCTQCPVIDYCKKCKRVTGMTIVGGVFTAVCCDCVLLCKEVEALRDKGALKW